MHCLKRGNAIEAAEVRPLLAERNPRPSGRGGSQGFTFTGLILAIFATIANLLFLHLPALQLAIAGVLVLVFSGLILLDTQRMIQSGMREPAMLVVSLYLDIINLFMALLEIFGGSR